MVMDGSEKISIYSAFSKMVLDDVKVEIFLISWHFLVVFWLRPTCPFIDTLIICYVKRCSGGTNMVQVSFMSDYLLFSSFEISNVFIPAESTVLGCFWVAFWT